MKTKPARDRLKEKNGHGLLINHLRTRYAFSPAMAEVLAEDAHYLRSLTVPGNREDGQIVWHAVKSTEPAGKTLKDCEYLAVTLTLHRPEDVVYRHQHGLVALKRRMHNPGHVDHRFRWMPTTCSGPCRPPVPTHGVRFFLGAGIGGRLGSESVDGMLRNPGECV